MELVEITATATVMLDTRRPTVASNYARMTAQDTERVMVMERVSVILALRAMHVIS